MLFRRKITRLAFAAFIAAMSFSMFAVGCSQKNAEPYGEFRLSLSLDYRLSDELTDKVDGTTQFLASRSISLPDKPVCKLYDAKSVDRDGIVYVTDDTQTAENAVIATKWLYYGALIADIIQEPVDSSDVSAGSSVPVLEVNDLFALYRMICDDYCIEKINMMPLLLRSDPKYDLEEDVVPYGVSIGFHLPSSFAEIIKKEPACNSNYYGAVTAAAFVRYGMIDLAALEKKPVEISTYGVEPKTVTLVGYIETQADRLLSTGVSMDENSDEYKTVIAQLGNPVFYSLDGNFLADRS